MFSIEITFPEYNNINEVLKYLKQDVYIIKDDLELKTDEYLESDLIGLDVISDGKVLGKLISINPVSPKNKVMEIIYNGRNILIPFHKDFILNIDLQNRKIEVKLIEGMI